MRMRYTLMAGVSAVALGFAGPAFAGAVVLTGHDNDFHCADGAGTASACAQLGAEAAFARGGSTLPVLVIDKKAQLTGGLNFESVPTVAVTPGAVTAGMFNHSVYSAFAVASVSTCGGCDNPVGTGTHLATFASSIDAFFAAGGGILGMTAATDPNGFAYVPKTGGTLTPITAVNGFVATPTGIAGIPGFVAVNGDETHNNFVGFDPFYKVAEVFDPSGTMPPTGTAITIFGSGAVLPTPEPISLSLLGVGLFGLGAARRLRRRQTR